MHAYNNHKTKFIPTAIAAVTATMSNTGPAASTNNNSAVLTCKTVPPVWVGYPTQQPHQQQQQQNQSNANMYQHADEPTIMQLSQELLESHEMHSESTKKYIIELTNRYLCLLSQFNKLIEEHTIHNNQYNISSGDGRNNNVGDGGSNNGLHIYSNNTSVNIKL